PMDRTTRNTAILTAVRLLRPQGLVAIDVVCVAPSWCSKHLRETCVPKIGSGFTKHIRSTRFLKPSKHWKNFRLLLQSMDRSEASHNALRALSGFLDPDSF